MGLVGTAVLPAMAPAAPLNVGPSTSVASYVIPQPGVSGVEITSLLTVNDPTKTATNGYKMVGIPDGMGAFKAGSDLTVTVNHELAADKGIARAHGQKGAFVSKYTVDPTTFEVKTGADLITSTKYWNFQTNSYGTDPGNVPGTTTPFGAAFKRFCSGFVATPAQLFNAATGNGFNGNLHMAGEETGVDGRLISTDIATGEAYQLPRAGMFSWENSVLGTTGNDKTFFVGSTDATPGFLGSYIGTKTATGNQWDKAGLTNGKRYALKALKPGGGFYATEFELRQANTKGTPVRFEWVEIDWNQSGTAQQAEATADGALAMVRIEDSAFDPSSPRDLYFVTTERPTQADQTKTDQYGGLWRVRLDDIANPAAGGSLTLMLDGNESVRMTKPDNMDIDTNGHIVIQEDPGNVAYVAGIYAYRIGDGQLKRIATFDPAQFTDVAKQDEESSGIIDTGATVGAGTFLFNVQAHNTVGLATGTGVGTVEEYVENGQLNSMKVDWKQVFGPATHKFVPVAPARILDTRAASAVNYTGAKPAAGSTTDVIVAGRGGVPATGAAAVVLNLTGVDSNSFGFVTAFPTGQTRPNTSSLNLNSGNTNIANQVTVALGTDGKISLYSEVGNHFAVDVAGYYVAAEDSKEGRLQLVSPTRLLDSRPGSLVGYTGAKPAAGATVNVKVTGAGGVPATGAAAVLVNLTATETTAAGFFTVYPKGGTLPNVSNLNVNGPGETAANSTIVPVGADGSISVFTEKGSAIIVDVLGYYTDTSAAVSTSGLFVPRPLSRMIDTRLTAAKPAAGATTGVDLLTPVPAAAAVTNVTLTATDASGFATAFKAGTPRPGTSTINAFLPVQTVANAAVIQVNAGKISVFTEVGTHLIVDVAGYITV
jgi:hypothetical protein